MKPPHDLDRCLFILILRTSDCTQDEVASAARCNKTIVGLTEDWFKQLPFHEAVALCNDQAIQSRVGQELVLPRNEIDAKVIAKASQVARDRILLRYRTDYLSQSIQAPIVSILESNKPGINNKTRKSGRIISFRLGNSSSMLFIIESICLEVLSRNTYSLPPPIGGPIDVHRFGIELRVTEPGECLIAKRFKLGKGDLDDFEVLCNSDPGFIYKLRIKIYYSIYPDKKPLEVYSDPFDLIFHNIHKRSRNLILEE